MTLKPRSQSTLWAGKVKIKAITARALGHMSGRELNTYFHPFGHLNDVVCTVDVVFQNPELRNDVSDFYTLPFKNGSKVLHQALYGTLIEGSVLSCTRL